MNTTTEPAADAPLEAASASSRSMSRSSVTSGTTPQNSASAPATSLARGAPAKIGAARPQRRQQPRGLALARHRDDRVGLAGRRPASPPLRRARGRDGCRSDRLASTHALEVGGSSSASRMIGVERLHRADRIRAGRRLAREHDRVDAFVDGVGRIADLRARRPRLDAHRLEHLRRDDHRNARAPARCG